MDETTTSEPRIVRASGGRFLALSTSEHRFRIGVEAISEEEVRAKFHESYAKWVEMANRPPRGVTLDD